MKAKDRLIVAADFDPRKVGGRAGFRQKVLELASQLKGMGVTIKVNTILRACGYDLIHELHGMDLQVMADLKLTDIPNTMETDGFLLGDEPPDLLTVMCNSGIAGIRAAKHALSHTQILGVTVLTSLDEEECQAIYTCSAKAGVLRLARFAVLAGLDGLVLSPKEVGVMRSKSELHNLSLNTPGIRPTWFLTDNDDQARVMTPSKAIKAGTHRLIIGRPITQADDPRGAVERTLEEIAAAAAEGGD